MASKIFNACETRPDLFRTAKALLRTRPIYHSSDAAIRGHVFCSYAILVAPAASTLWAEKHCRSVGYLARTLSIAQSVAMLP